MQLCHAAHCVLAVVTKPGIPFVALCVLLSADLSRPYTPTQATDKNTVSLAVKVIALPAAASNPPAGVAVPPHTTTTVNDSSTKSRGPAADPTPQNTAVMSSSESFDGTRGFPVQGNVFCSTRLPSTFARGGPCVKSCLHVYTAPGIQWKMAEHAAEQIHALHVESYLPHCCCRAALLDCCIPCIACWLHTSPLLVFVAFCMQPLDLQYSCVPTVNAAVLAWVFNCSTVACSGPHLLACCGSTWDGGQQASEAATCGCCQGCPALETDTPGWPPSNAVLLSHEHVNEL